ncbi:hypothetical protein CAP48_08735 [Advenella sp. S44]|uniref:Bug family tripartite tricarboxylate transporter substrate binding protein n=1 Tax=Advenella sp. S44 TaxID=1982755 RepID=UPI000C29DA8E|nr:tripartite tricarboxylate transporter substrate binding protein [Advenella sp. S44]PJX26089.1 hypothetical protein CAP48_08735 [Advenella sp. S44]
MTKLLKHMAFAITMSLGCTLAHAAYPNKPVNIVVPFGAGSATDMLARAMAQALSEKWGQSVTVDNKPGAGGAIGASYVARSDPDGYTLMMGTNGPMAANPSLYKSLTYDPIKDFAPIALMGKLPMVLIANKDTQPENVEALIAQAKQNPGQLNFGASNTTARVWVELLKQMADIDVATVLYSNVGSMMTDLISGRITYAFENVGPSVSQISAGAIKALAVTTSERAAFAPDTPTIAEYGLDKHQLVVWFAMFAPRDTPQEIIDTINETANEALKSDKIKQTSAQIGMAPAGGTDKDLKDYQLSEVKKWHELVKLTGVTIN